jgi:hypothetical protein
MMLNSVAFSPRWTGWIKVDNDKQGPCS